MHATVLDSRVLVLNKSYVPIRVTSVYDAICKLFSEIAEVVTVTDEGVYESHSFDSWAEVSEFKALFEEEYSHEDNEWVRSPSVQLIVPRVIRLLSYNKVPRYDMRLSRKNIYERDNHVCQYCHEKFPVSQLNIDHVVPRSKGGKNSWTNLVTTCIPCNTKKADKDLKDVGFKLLKKPGKPHPSGKFKVKSQKRYRDWDAFVSDAYWNTELKE